MKKACHIPRISLKCLTTKPRLFLLISGIYLIAVCIFVVKAVPSLGRSEQIKSAFYPSSQQLASTILSSGLSVELPRVIDSKFHYYQETKDAFYTNIRITIGLCIICCIILFLDRKNVDLIAIPGFPDLKIPIQIAYLIVPAALMYYWLSFGFLLFHVIDARMTLFNLIDAQYILNHVNDAGMMGKTPNHFLYFASLTRADDLRDTGFLDSWFLTFLPHYFPVNPQFKGFDRAVPIATMVSVGILAGISHGFALGMPFSWLLNNKNKTFSIVALFLMGINLFFLVASHFTFYFSGHSSNWLSIVILIVGLAAFPVIVQIGASNNTPKNVANPPDACNPS